MPSERDAEPTDAAPATALRALVAAQFFGAFNDNALRIAVALLGVASATAALDSAEARATAAQTRMTLAFVAFTLPLALMSIPAGVLADRVSKRSVIVALKALEIALMLGAGAALWVDPGGGPLPLGLLACMGAQSALFSPAKYGILPEILPERDLSRGNGLLEMCSFLAIIAGTYAGGLLLWCAGEDTWVIGAVLAALAAVGFGASLWIPPVAPARSQGGVSATWKGAASALREDRPLRLAVLATVFFWALASLVSQDILIYGKVVLGLSDAAVGLPLTALALGIAVGSPVAGALARGARDAPLEYGLIPLGLGGIASFTLGIGLLAPGFAGTLGLMLPLGISSGLLAVPLNVLTQWRSPKDRRGALIAYSNTFVFAGVIAGSLGANALSRAGLSPAGILLAVSALAAAGTLLARAWLAGSVWALVRRLGACEPRAP